MRDLLGDMLVPIVVVVIMISSVFASIFTFGYYIDKAQCAGFSEATGMETTYSGLQCYVKTEKGFVPKEYVFGKAIEARVKADK